MRIISGTLKGKPIDFLKNMNIPKTGTENFGGVTATSGNIAIATGTLDKKMYVFVLKLYNSIFHI